MDLLAITLNPHLRGNKKWRGSLKLYSKKYHRYVERKIHFGVGKSVRTSCGLVLFSRHVMVSVFSGSDGALITDDLERITCKRCLATRETRLRKILEIENSSPGIFDYETLCGEQWLLEHALDVKQTDIDSQRLELSDGKRNTIISNAIKTKDRKYILRSLVTKLTSGS